MSELKKTAKHASIYFIGVLLSRIASFIMLPIYTRCLTPADYGILELLTMTVDIVAIVTSVGITAGIFKYYYDFKNESERNAVISTAFYLIIILYLVAAGICILNSNFFATLLFDGKYSFAIKLVFCSMFFQACVNVPLTYIKAIQKSTLFVIFSVFRLIVHLSLSIYLIVFLKKGVMGAVYAEFITTSFFGVILTVYTFKGVGFTYCRENAIKLISFGAPFILTNIGAFILTFSDRYFLKAFCDLETVGIYSLGYKIGFLLSFVVSRPFQNIWAAQRFEVVKQDNYTQTFNQALLVFSYALFTIGLCLSLFSRDLFRIMSDPLFVNAYRIVPIVVLAYIVQSLTSFFDFGLFHTGRSIEITKGTFAAVFSILVLSFWLIPIYGGLGAATATLIAFLVRLVYFYYSAQKQFKINYQLGNVYRCMLIAVSIYVIYWVSLKNFLILNNIFFSILFSFFLILAYFCLLLGFKIIPYSFVTKTIEMVTKKFSS